MSQGHRDRHLQLEENIPDVWNYKTLLYIGAKVVEKSKARWGGMMMLPKFAEVGYFIDILEAWPNNVLKLQALNAEKRVFKHIIKGDIRNIDMLIRKTKYDIVMWYHGPEHVQENEVIPILQKLEEHANKMVIIACPWGIYKKGKVGGNAYEAHTSHLYPELFESIKWETDTIGPKDVPGSNILAWKRRRMMPNLRDRPWLPEGAIKFMGEILDKDSLVLEFGAGSSTIWFARHVKHVLSFENKELWYNLVSKGLKQQGLRNVSLRMDPLYPGLGIRNENGKFDFILIDGRGRVKCAQTSHGLLKPGSWIGLDNSWRGRYLKIHILFQKLGWERKDIFDYYMPEHKMGTFTFWRKPE